MIITKILFRSQLAKLLSVFLLALGISIQDLGAQKARIDTLLSELDATIRSKDEIKREKQARIEPLRYAMLNAHNDEERFLIAEKLFKEYKSYSIDTSLLYALQARKFAANVGRPEYIWRGMLMEAEGQKGLGFYHRSLQLLDSLPAEARDSMHYEILERYCSVYYSLCENTTSMMDPTASHRHLLAYRDSLVLAADNPVDSALNIIESYIANENYHDAIAVYDQLMSDQHPDLSDVQPMLDYIVSIAYINDGETEKAIEHLAIASIDDLKRGNRRYNALPTLAKLLYKNGDVDRAYQYIMCSLEDINDSKASSRMYRVTDAVPIISKAYEERESRDRRNRLIINVLAGVLILLFGVFVVKVIKDNRTLNNEHNRLNMRNEELADAKNKSDKLNEQLEESGRTKDDNIGELFNLCSDYIQTMSKEQSSLLKIYKSGNSKDMEQALLAMQTPERLSSFFVRFDKVVLDIFPGYVEKFNELLDEDKRIVPPAGRLTPELRIYALLKLGITDPTKIAAFLRYSTQTVYNYQFRIRSASKLDKEAFLNGVRSI